MTDEITSTEILRLRVGVLDCTLDRFALIVGCSSSAVRRWETGDADKIEGVYLNVLYQIVRAAQKHPKLGSMLQPFYSQGTSRLQYVINGIVYDDTPWRLDEGKAL